MSTQWYQLGSSTLLLVMTLACGDDSTDGNAAEAESGGDDGADSPVVTDLPARVINPDPGTPTGALADADADHDQIQGCWSQTACPASYAQMRDDFYTKIHQAISACLMTGLSARTAGVYLHNTSSNSARGHDSTAHALLVFDDGSVVHTSKRTTSGGQFDQQGTAGITYTEAERCQLADATYFDECKSAVETSATPAMDAPGWVCLFTDPATEWLTDCEPVEPTCE